MTTRRQRQRREAQRITAARNSGVVGWLRKPARTTERRVRRQGKGNW